MLIYVYFGSVFLSCVPAVLWGQNFGFPSQKYHLEHPLMSWFWFGKSVQHDRARPRWRYYFNMAAHLSQSVCYRFQFSSVSLCFRASVFPPSHSWSSRFLPRCFQSVLTFLFGVLSLCVCGIIVLSSPACVASPCASCSLRRPVGEFELPLQLPSVIIWKFLFPTWVLSAPGVFPAWDPINSEWNAYFCVFF